MARKALAEADNIAPLVNFASTYILLDFKKPQFLYWANKNKDSHIVSSRHTYDNE